MARQCTIDIKNECTNYILSNPRMYLDSGRCVSPLPITLGPSASGSVQFTKIPFSMAGCVGVITYDLINNRTSQLTEKMAVMFHVPFNYTFYSNWYAVGIFDMSKNSEKKLYSEMYYNEELRSFIRSTAGGTGLTYESHDVTIKATMTKTPDSVITVQLKNTPNE
ncbi:DELTA-sagatoxin-Srs1a-like [Centroberyx affinis]|uniref:DELTA-sagatoxin-Srs1a-like n=1 Tax=Centroberyx affinis TaxID=166261 RepID=UPI003A5B935C